MNIISIDTSGSFCSVSIYLSDNTRYSIISESPLSHSSELAVNLKKIINKYQIQIRDLDCVVANIGPGSFTGLRIGISFAKGLCLSNDIPLIPVDSFDIIDLKIDCDKDLFYYGVYSHKNFIYGKKYEKKNGGKPKLISLEEKIDGSMYIYGLDRNKEFDSDITHIDYDSSDLIDIAIKRFKSKAYHDLNSINPIYIDYNDSV